jgi:hypothetical protein
MCISRNSGRGDVEDHSLRSALAKSQQEPSSIYCPRNTGSISRGIVVPRPTTGKHMRRYMKNN